MIEAIVKRESNDPCVPPSNQDYAVLHLSGEDYASLVWLTRMNISVPEVMASPARPVAYWTSFIDRLRHALLDDPKA